MKLDKEKATKDNLYKLSKEIIAKVIYLKKLNKIL